MPLYQSSLRDTNNDVALSVVGSTIAIKDYSNYIASTETTQLQAAFTFKYIAVRLYGSSTRYEFSTVAGKDILIASPSTYLSVPEQSNYTFSTDGLYEVELIALPQYDSKATYNNTHFVHNNGNIYKSLVNANVASLSDTNSWQTIGTTSDRTGYENISSKYRDVEYKQITAESEECFAELIYQVNCVLLNMDCNFTELCSNKEWNSAARMLMIYEVLPQMVLDQEYDKVVTLINELQTLCDCCS